MVRIPPLEPPYEPVVEEQLRAMMPAGAEPIALFRTFARNLPMTRAMHPWGRYELGRELSLSRRQREIVIDRTCARCGCEYEWGVHVQVFAERAGLTAPQLTSLAHGDAGDACWDSAAERLLLRAVDALHDTGDIDDPLWTELAATYTSAQLLDLVMLVGWYHAISFVARAARVAAEPGAPTFVDAAPGEPPRPALDRS